MFSVTIIGRNTFNGCSQLRSAVILCQDGFDINLLSSCVKLSIVVLPSNVIDSLNLNHVRTMLPHCSVVADSPRARIKALEAVYWNLSGAQLCSKDELNWLYILLISLNRCAMRWRFRIPNEIVYLVLRNIMWSDMKSLTIE